MSANIKQSIFIKGELSVEEDLTVEGRVEGKIELEDHNLSIGPGAEVHAEVHARSVMIAGTFTGSIVAREMVEIRPSGSAQGSVECPHILLVDGATFKGRVDTGRTTNGAAALSLPKTQAAKMGQGPL